MVLKPRPHKDTSAGQFRPVQDVVDIFSTWQVQGRVDLALPGVCPVSTKAFCVPIKKVPSTLTGCEMVPIIVTSRTKPLQSTGIFVRRGLVKTQFLHPFSKVKVLFKFTKAGGNRSDEDTRKLMQVSWFGSQWNKQHLFQQQCIHACSRFQ